MELEPAQIVSSENVVCDVKYDPNTSTVMYIDDRCRHEVGNIIIIDACGKKLLRIVHYILQIDDGKHVAFVRRLTIRQLIALAINKLGIKVHVPRQID